jgi:rubrerythrin/uncharacterized damage-inducible protein DinB
MATYNAVHWSNNLVHLLALATRLEEEGQYNIAKLLRAAADSQVRRAAYQLDLRPDKTALSAEVGRAMEALAVLEMGQALGAALQRGRAALDEGRLPLILETPNPFVCRTCGYTVVGRPDGNCPVCGAWPDSFQEFMPNYWFDALDPFEALVVLRRTPEETAALISGLGEELLTRQPDDGGWAIRHVLSHMRDAQGVLSGRVSLMLEQENPPLSSLAVSQWATQEESRPPSTQEIFDSYRASREEMIRQLEAIPLKDWWRTGQHEEFGPMTILRQVSYFAAHEHTHLPQIAALRRQFAGA